MYSRKCSLIILAITIGDRRKSRQVLENLCQICDLGIKTLKRSSHFGAFDCPFLDFQFEVKKACEIETFHVPGDQNM